MKLVKVLALGAAVAASGAFAQEEESANSTDELVAKATKPAAPAFKFSLLPFCLRPSGQAEVKLPGSEAWVAIEEGKFYPLGSIYRTGKDGEVTVQFGKDCLVKIGGDAQFGTRSVAIGDRTRTITLMAGAIEVSLARNMPEGSFVIASPSFVVRDPAGDSKYTYTNLGDGDEVTVRCVTGTMVVEGRHFKIPQMRAANEFRIRSNHDNLVTLLYGLSGDYIVKLDQGVKETIEIDDEGKQKSKVEAKTMDWHLSSETKIMIDRALPSIGERMSVHTMCFDTAGSLKSECCFCEGRAEINSGELVPTEKTEGEDISKRAAEATEESAATEESEEKTDNNTENNSSEE